MKRIFIAIILTVFIFTALKAQDVSIYETNTGALSLNIPTQVFFKNNEYKRKIAYGYTLGGFRMIPNVEYQPLKNLTISAGINVLRYWGADKYGQYNFVNVPYYSDTNTQNQLHKKPYFRINWQINKRLNLVMGNLCTDSFHYLPVPLYNRELAYSSDGEEGLQLIYQGKYWRNDAWLNWQNFNFYNDVDRESFDLGTSGALYLIRNNHYTFQTDYSFIWHHNGGELDTISTLDLDHWANGHAAITLSAVQSKHIPFEIAFSLNYLFSKDMKNDTWAFKSGHAWFPTLSCSNDTWNATIGYYDSKDMMTFYGTNFFSNLAQRDNNITYPHNRMLYASLDYDISIGRDYKVSHTNYKSTVVGEFFYKFDTDNSIEKEDNSLSFGLGLIFSAKPKFQLYKFRNLN